jgi:hypothetical protein
VTGSTSSTCAESASVPDYLARPDRTRALRRDRARGQR